MDSIVDLVAKVENYWQFAKVKWSISHKNLRIVDVEPIFERRLLGLIDHVAQKDRLNQRRNA